MEVPLAISSNSSIRAASYSSCLKDIINCQKHINNSQKQTRYWTIITIHNSLSKRSQHQSSPNSFPQYHQGSESLNKPKGDQLIQHSSIKY